MKKLNEETAAECISDLDLDSNIVFAYNPDKSRMYVLKTIGSGAELMYRFMNIANVRTKLTNGFSKASDSVVEAIAKGCEVFVLESAWQLAMMINRYTVDQEDINSEHVQADEEQREAK